MGLNISCTIVWCALHHVLTTKRDDECVVWGETDRPWKRGSWDSGVLLKFEMVRNVGHKTEVTLRTVKLLP